MNGSAFGTIIQIGDILVSEDVVSEFFACDYPVCRGECCIEGDAGAPLEEDELEALEEAYEVYSPFMSEEGLRRVDEVGFFEVDPDGDLVTPCQPITKECAYCKITDALPAVPASPAPIGPASQVSDSSNASPASIDPASPAPASASAPTPAPASSQAPASASAPTPASIAPVSSPAPASVCQAPGAKCALCAIEMAGCKKPISCSLYPIRVSKMPGGGLALNLHRWRICAPAYQKGKREGIRVFEFLRGPLTERFGADFYEALTAAAAQINRS